MQHLGQTWFMQHLGHGFMPHLGQTWFMQHLGQIWFMAAFRTCLYATFRTDMVYGSI